MRDKITRQLLIIAGTLLAGIGIAGIFLPVLPTTPFLLLATVCYMRSSKRSYNWLLNNKLCGRYLKNYMEGKGMPLRAKIYTIILLWVTIGATLLFFIDSLIIRIILLIMAAGVTLHILLIKNLVISCQRK